jgi:membrane protease subunit HflK
MSDNHDHPKPEQGHEHDQDDHDRGAPAPMTAEDAGSQALSEALKSSFAIIKIVMVILVVVFLCSGIFTVSSQDVAVILRFGKPIGGGPGQLLRPGLHWSFPYPIDEIVKIPIGQIQTVRSTVGWYATLPELEAAQTEPDPGPSLNPASDGYTLTADGNIIHVRSTLQYRINDPLRYAFNFASGTNLNLFTGGSNLIQNALNNALFHTSAHYTVDKALGDRTGFKERLLARVNQLIEEQGLGVTVETSDLDLIPPRQVKDKFKEVLDAQQDAINARDTARGYANEIVNKAHGEASALVNAGETARNQLLQSVEAEARYLSDQLPYYNRDPKLYLQRLQIEAFQRLMTNAQVEKWFIPDRADGKSRELRLQLSREPQKPTVKEPEKTDAAPMTRDVRRK